MTRFEKLVKGLGIIASITAASKQDYDFNHDVMYIGSAPRDHFSPEALQELKELGFEWSEEFNCWYHF